MASPSFTNRERCGIIEDMAKLDDLTGRTFGRLIVLSRAPRIGAYWLCVCICGTPTPPIHAQSLKRGVTRSCGCLMREFSSQLNRTHGKSKTVAYHAWSGIIDRCTNPNSKAYAVYSKLGVSDVFRYSFEAFDAELGPRPPGKGWSVDRIDNNRGYFPSNIRWATQKMQCRNQKTNRHISFNGETHCLSEWAEIIGVRSSVLHLRIFTYGWPLERAMTPVSRFAHNGPVYRTEVTHNGKTRSVAEWCEHFGIRWVTFGARVNYYGWSVEKAATTPQRKWVSKS